MGPTPLWAVAARAVAALRVVAARGGVTRKVYPDYNIRGVTATTIL